MRRSRGLSLVELLLGVAITSVLVLGYASFQNLNVKSAGQAQITHALETLRGSFVSLLSDQEAFYNTIRQNYIPAGANNSASVSCVWSMICDAAKETAGGFPDCPALEVCPSSPTPDTPDTEANLAANTPVNRRPNRLFNLYSADRTTGTPTYDSITATSGITLQGGTCNSFDATNGNDHCPFRYELRWWSECTDAACNCVNFVADGRLKVKFAANTDLGKYYANLQTMNELERGFPRLRIPLTRGQPPTVELEVYLPDTWDELGGADIPLSAQTFTVVPNANELIEVWRRTPSCADTNPDRLKATSARIRVVRTLNKDNYCQALQVNYRVESPADPNDPNDPIALHGTDYTLNNATEGSLLIPVSDADAHAQFEILPLPTALVRDGKQVTIQLLPGNGYALPADNPGTELYKKKKTVMIRDNRHVTGPITFSGIAGIDSDGGGSISVTAQGATDQDVAGSFTDARGVALPQLVFLARENGVCRATPLKYRWRVAAVDQHIYPLNAPATAKGYPALTDIVFNPADAAGRGVGTTVNLSAANGNVDGRFKIEVVANDGPCGDADQGICAHQPPLTPTHPGVYGVVSSFWVDAYDDQAPTIRHIPGGPSQFPPWFNVVAAAPPFNVDFSPFYEVSDDGYVNNPISVTFSSSSPGAFTSGPTVTAAINPGWNIVPSSGAAPVYGYSVSGPGQSISVQAFDGFKLSDDDGTAGFPFTPLTENNVNVNQCPYIVTINADTNSPAPNTIFNLSATFGDDPYPTGSTTYSWTGDAQTTFGTPNGTVVVGAPQTFAIATTATVTTPGPHTITLTVTDGQPPPCPASGVFIVNP